ncbi:repressor LexA [Myxococcaceae bacterium]|nr:repressor LexA [Myxococcaceae bacterium]
MALTRRQHQVYESVRQFISKKGYSPSLEEIAASLGLASVATVHRHVALLVEKGLLRKDAKRSRSVEVVEEEAQASVLLPLLGVVSAGSPLEVFEEPETIAVPRELVGRRRTSFVLRVRGDSMIDEQIRDGDFVVVESRNEARDGEVVVALVRGREATLKRFERRGDRVRLVPANASLRPLDLPAADVEIRGIVRGLVRLYPRVGATRRAG